MRELLTIEAPPASVRVQCTHSCIETLSVHFCAAVILQIRVAKTASSARRVGQQWEVEDRVQYRSVDIAEYEHNYMWFVASSNSTSYVKPFLLSGVSHVPYDLSGESCNISEC